MRLSAIIDNDATTFQFSLPSYTANESRQEWRAATVTLSRIGDPNTTYSVSYATSDLTAVAGRDYLSTYWHTHVWSGRDSPSDQRSSDQASRSANRRVNSESLCQIRQMVPSSARPPPRSSISAIPISRPSQRTFLLVGWSRVATA